MGFSDLQLNGEPKKVVAITEPGHKIPITNYKQIGCWCEVCQDTTAQVYSHKTRKIRCLRCKTTRQTK